MNTESIMVEELTPEEIAYEVYLEAFYQNLDDYRRNPSDWPDYCRTPDLDEPPLSFTEFQRDNR